MITFINVVTGTTQKVISFVTFTAESFWIDFINTIGNFIVTIVKVFFTLK